MSKIVDIQNCISKADIIFKQGDKKKALSIYLDAFSSSLSLHNDRSDDIDCIILVAFSSSRTGFCLESMCLYNDAIQSFELSVHLYKNILAQIPKICDLYSRIEKEYNTVSTSLEICIKNLGLK